MVSIFPISFIIINIIIYGFLVSMIYNYDMRACNTREIKLPIEFVDPCDQFSFGVWIVEIFDDAV